MLWFHMYKHILIATDGSEAADKAVGHGLALAKALGAIATAVTVTDIYPTGPYSPIPFPATIERYEAAAAESAAKILASVAEDAERLGVSCRTVHVKDQAPAEGIIATSAAEGCDLVVMGTHGRRGISRLLLGSQARKVVTLSPVPVLVCR
jgi:nucleotide-binding universal stress UspA family protein